MLPSSHWLGDDFWLLTLRSDMIISNRNVKILFEVTSLLRHSKLAPLQQQYCNAFPCWYQITYWYLIVENVRKNRTHWPPAGCRPLIQIKLGRIYFRIKFINCERSAMVLGIGPRMCISRLSARDCRSGYSKATPTTSLWILPIIGSKSCFLIRHAWKLDGIDA